MKMICPVLFGLERALADELLGLGYAAENILLEDGQVSLDLGEERADLAYHLARCNLRLRTAERCLLELFSFETQNFEDFFEQAAALPWEDYLPFGGRIRVDGFSRNSKLFAVPALQSLLKKALVRRLLWARGLDASGALPEDESRGVVDLRFSLVRDRLSLRVETSGAGLHKRGYRPLANEAPIKETLAAGLLKIMRWNPQGTEALADLFCGSGTLAIEAALMAAAKAPGLNRRFAMENWSYLPAEGMARARLEAVEAEKNAAVPTRAFIFASDIDPAAVALARENARRAGVTEWICFSQGDALLAEPQALMAASERSRILFLSNPPYGERLSSPEEVKRLTSALGRRWLPEGRLPEGLRWGVISADEGFEQACAYAADKRRKLYNGMLKCYLYQYFRLGVRPRLNPRSESRRSGGRRGGNPQDADSFSRGKDVKTGKTPGKQGR